jgi:hypothetical protein
MNKDIETTIYLQDGERIHLDEWDNGGAWISLQVSGASAYTALTRDEAQQLLVGLQAILAKEVTA